MNIEGEKPKMTMPPVIHFMKEQLETGELQIQSYGDDVILMATNCGTNESDMHLMTKKQAKEISEFLLKASEL